jgi:hypothetical protein
MMEVEMAVMTKNYKPGVTRFARVTNFEKSLEKLIPRKCMMAAVGLIVAGFSVPLLMALQVLPVTFLTCFAGFSCVASGGVLALIFCGEI